MQKVNFLALLAILTICCGCETIQNLGDAFAGLDTQGHDGSATVVAESVQRGIPFLPSPIREAALAAVAGLAAWAVSRRNNKGGWQK